MSDSDFLDAHNARHVWHPMAHPREMEQSPPRIIARGEGVHVEDHRGHRTIDAVGGLWNVNLGYSSEPVKRAIADQLQTLPYASAFRGTTNAPLIELSETLTHWLEPEGMRRFAFTAGGSDSVEVSLRLARQYWKVVGQKDRTKFLAFRKGYHGTHFGAASVNGNDRFRRPYEPLLPGCFHVPFPWTYRNPFGESDPQRLARLCLNLLDEEIRFQGADTIAAFIFEPVLGAGGVGDDLRGPPHRILDGVTEGLVEGIERVVPADESHAHRGPRVLRSQAKRSCRRRWTLRPRRRTPAACPTAASE